MNPAVRNERYFCLSSRGDGRNQPLCISCLARPPAPDFDPCMGLVSEHALQQFGSALDRIIPDGRLFLR